MYPISTPVLYALSVIGSGCGFITQMLVSGFWATAYSYDVYHFSVNLAFYFLSLGIGTLISTKWKKATPQLLFIITLLLCSWTGLSISILRWGIVLGGNIGILPIFTVSVAGILAGHIIPLTIRLGENDPRVNLSTIFFLDYTAAILFTLIFTLVLLVPLGYGKTMLILAFFCFSLTAVLITLSKMISKQLVLVLLIAVALPYPAYRLALQKVDSYRVANPELPRVLASHQSHYQKIVLTEETANQELFPGLKRHVLYLDGFIQFSSFDEQAYHICIANIPAAAADYVGHPAKNALILGGGDGLAARNLLALPNIERITLVELDPAMISLAQHHPKVRSYNLDSLRNPKVKVIIGDAFRWVKTTEQQYDVIIVDFPAPKNIALSRLFSGEFYRHALKLLSPHGFMAIQAGPSYSPNDPQMMTISKVTASIKKTIASLGYHPDIYANAQDEDAFVFVTPDESFDMLAFSKKIGMLGRKNLGHLCTYNPDWTVPEVEINTLNTLKTSGYMLSWFRDAGTHFFYFRGAHGVFLPE